MISIDMRQGGPGSPVPLGAATWINIAPNKLRARFYECLSKVKNILFRAHCMCFYASQLWFNLKKRLQVIVGLSWSR